MPERFAIYFAPARDSQLWERAQAWLAQPELAGKTVSARRYGFHATIKAPMVLKAGTDRAGLEAALQTFGETAGPAELAGLAPRPIDGFLALTTEPQPVAVTRLAETVTLAFEPFRAPLTEAEMARRQQAPLTPRQVELLRAYGYPYVMDEFRFHMTLTDRLAAAEREAVAARAADWFGEALAKPILLDRLVLFREPAPGADFERLDDYVLSGRA